MTLARDDTHSRDTGEDDGVCQPRQLLLILVRAYGLVDVVERRLGDPKGALERLVIRVVARSVSQDLAKRGTGQRLACPRLCIRIPD